MEKITNDTFKISTSDVPGMSYDKEKGPSLSFRKKKTKKSKSKRKTKGCGCK